MCAGPWVGLFDVTEVMGGCSSVREALNWKGHTQCVGIGIDIEAAVAWYASFFTGVKMDTTAAALWDLLNEKEGDNFFWAWADVVRHHYVVIDGEKCSWDLAQEANLKDQDPNAKTKLEILPKTDKTITFRGWEVEGGENIRYHLRAHTYTYTHTHTHTRTHTRTHAHTYTYTHTHMYISVYA